MARNYSPVSPIVTTTRAPGRRDRARISTACAHTVPAFGPWDDRAALSRSSAALSYGSRRRAANAHTRLAANGSREWGVFRPTRDCEMTIETTTSWEVCPRHGPCVRRNPPLARRDRGCVPSGGSRVPSTRASCHAGHRWPATFLPGPAFPRPSLVNQRSAHSRLALRAGWGKNANAPPGTLRRWGVDRSRLVREDRIYRVRPRFTMPAPFRSTA